MDHVAVVYNARSGALLAQAGAAQSLPERLEKLFARRAVTVQARPFDPRTLAADVRELLAGWPDAVLAAGGDGTVRSVAEHLLGGEVPLGILPGGTMNVLARDLAVPEDIEHAVEALVAAPVERIDVASVMAYTSVMSDGEIAQLSTPLTYGISPRALAVLAPNAAAS
ncbi:diacylglycerol/lipid kinase family protein [Dactylosporangium sp. CS-047395]|uniref:diacylglycerol/lipid kinase family protein n=1 Tax=Dactylosporangium sp. CS-047395 TaxID=3239936 RepID=UPI003D91317D